MDAMFWVWMAVIIVTLVLEFATMDLVSIWFTIGAVVPFILAGTKAVGWELQLIIFIVLSAVLIISLRKVTKNWLLRHSSKEKLNTYVGKQYKMLDDLNDDDLGHIKINDVVWSAKSENGEKIAKGEMVEVVRMSGNKAIVRKIDKKEKK